MTMLVLMVTIGIVAVVGFLFTRNRADRRLDALGVRRGFQYAVLFALVIISAIGSADLLARVFGAEVPQWRDSADLARSLTFTFLGLPLVLLLGWFTRRSHRADPDERDSHLFAAYLALASLTGLAVAAGAAQSLVSQLIAGGDPDRYAAGTLIAWAGVWVVHWVLAARTLKRGRNAGHLLLGSMLGLGLGMVGLITTLGGALDLLTTTTLVGNARFVLAPAAGTLVVGALIWVRYWAVAAARLPRQSAWLAYVLLVGVGGGLVTALAGAWQLIWRLLVWGIGDRETTGLSGWGVEFAMLAIGVLLWWYHQSALADPHSPRHRVRRVYEYLVAAIGLVAAAVGVGTVLVAVIEAATPGADVGMTTVNTLLAAVTLLIIGVPVWWWHWRQAQIARAADATEVTSLPRRVYVTAVFGVAGVATVISLLIAVSSLVRDLVDGAVGAATLMSMRYSLGVLLASAVVAAYHAAVVGQDRAIRSTHAPAAVATSRRVTLLGGADAHLADRITAATGADVRMWESVEAVPAWDGQQVLDVLDQHPEGDLLLVATPAAATDGDPLVVQVHRIRRTDEAAEDR